MIENNSEIDDTKNIIEKIVGEDTFLTKKKKTQDSKNKKEFLLYYGPSKQDAIDAKIKWEKQVCQSY